MKKEKEPTPPPLRTIKGDVDRTMKNIPKRIFLQTDPENEKPKDFKELNEVTWCEDRINDNDIEYVLQTKKKCLHYLNIRKSLG